MLGKILNGLIERAADQWLKSEKAKRYAASFVLRAGQALMAYLIKRWADKYGIDGAAQLLITGHWTAILELVAPAFGAAVIELISMARAQLNAKTLEVAVEAPANTLTPQMAKEVAKVELAQALK